MHVNDAGAGPEPATAPLPPSRMRIAVVAPPWLPVPPIGYGGTEAVLDGLCRGLAQDGHDVLLCTTDDSTCPVERWAGLPRSLGVEAMSAARELRHVVTAYDAIADWGADVVHDHTVAGPFYADQVPGLSVVTTNHGPFDAELGPIYGALAGRVPIIAISRHQAATSGRIPIAAVIHHAVDPAQFPVGTGGGGYALFLGRMTPTKGVDEAIRLARAAGVPLQIAAKMREPDERAFFERVVAPRLGPDVEYVGEVGGAEKLGLLGEARCLLNPIAWPEPFGMVMVEALACGTPVIATPAGAAPEIVEDGVTGYLRVEEPDLVAALDAAGGLDRAACRRSVERRFALPRLAREHLGLYNCVRCGARSAVGPVWGRVPEAAESSAWTTKRVSATREATPSLR
jgi:glycosyltransferase involved in cell wall biosynthesis